LVGYNLIKTHWKIIQNALIEPALKESKPGDKFQFERHGYFCVDNKFTTTEKLVLIELLL
jgi:glutaminyl-tRNA synthetase